MRAPLLAAGEVDLAGAVEMFRSDDADVRDEGSRHVDRFLRESLAPLVRAFGDSDPEVRRRAREAFLALLPARPPEEPGGDDETDALLAGAFVPGVGRGRARLVNNDGLVVRLEVDDAEENRGERLLGVSRMPVVDPAFRAQLRLAAGRGFFVLQVEPDGNGAKPGLRRFDIVTTLNGAPVKDGASLLAALGEAPDLGRVRLGVLRGGNPTELPAKEAGR